MDTTITTLLTATGGAFLGKFVGPAAEQLGKAAWERAQQLGQQAHQLLAAVGRAPQPVEPKLLVPLVQAAALESDERLAEKWAALLANAADPTQKTIVEADFVEVLRLLVPADAQVLELLYRGVALDDPESLNREMQRVQTEGFAETAGLTKERFAVSIDKLLRLRLCAVSTQSFGLFSGEPLPPAAASVCPTIYGRAFIKACSPPTAGF